MTVANFRGSLAPETARIFAKRAKGPAGMTFAGECP